MKALSIHETKTHLSRLLHDVDKGGKVVFGARGQAQYQITKVQPKKVDRSKALGAWKDRVWVAPDAFSPETDAEIAELMLEEDVLDPNKKEEK